MKKEKTNLAELMVKDLNYTETEKGAVALKSTLSSLLDAFGLLGAMRTHSEDSIYYTFRRALDEDPLLAMKLLFYIRDIYLGQGERRTFRVILKKLAYDNPELVVKNLDNILLFGRGDDYLVLLGTPVEKEVVLYINKQLAKDIKDMKSKKRISLLAKWLPSANTSSWETRKLAYKLAKGLELPLGKYRKLLSTLRKYIDVVEVKMVDKKWDKVDYNKVPSIAQKNYSDAFVRHDKERYENYLESVRVGKAKINARAVYPYNIVSEILNNKMSPSKSKMLDIMWNNLPDYLEGSKENILCVVDVSGSMRGLPMEVAISLGLYAAERNYGMFNGKFITFSESPEMVEVLKNTTVYNKVKAMCNAMWGYTTNIESVFKLILDLAVKHNLPQDELPTKLYIISDMQFDEAAEENLNTGNKTFMTSIRERFEYYGYKMPTLIYWNVKSSKAGMFQDDRYGENIAFVSGFSPVIFKNVLLGVIENERVDAEGNKKIETKVDPMKVMLETLNQERYAVVKV